jgi:prephenate dehydrogenase
VTEAAPRRANVVGLGLVGGSVALGLRARGWHVTGDDAAADRVERAHGIGVVDEVGLDATAEISFVAVPALSAAAVATDVLARTDGLVTDVASVKGPICRDVEDPRFLGGHPMAGSELHGLDGADADMFAGAVWVLTPTASTPDHVFAAVGAVVRSLGAELVALPPERHDEIVAVVSHVPHLVAASMMVLADDRASDHAALMRLAAGGFRDMTRVAAGHPDIWLDICAQNQRAITDVLSGLLSALGEVKQAVGSDDRDGLIALLNRARAARTNLPRGAGRPETMVEVRVPVADRPGVAAEVFTLAAELGVNVHDFEVYHSAEGSSGVLIAVVETASADLFRGGLIARGFRPSVRSLE